jgi:hypothetical protein
MRYGTNLYLRQTIMYVSISMGLCLAAALAGAAPPEKSIRIDTTGAKYALQDFSFEVSPQTGGAGIRLEYTYPPAWLQGDDSDRGPGSTIAMLPGLTYDAATHAIVYVDGSARTTCATEVDHTVAFWKTVHMKPTGACRVSARVTRHADSDGWITHRYNTLDTYFEVRSK